MPLTDRRVSRVSLDVGGMVGLCVCVVMCGLMDDS